MIDKMNGMGMGGMGPRRVRRGGLGGLMGSLGQTPYGMQMMAQLGQQRGAQQGQPMGQPPQMNMNQMSAQDWQGLLAQEARNPGSTDPNMLRVGLGMIGVNANSPNSIAPRNGAMQPPSPQQPQMRGNPAFYQPNWGQIFGPSLDRYQQQAQQSQQAQANGGMGGFLGRLRQGFNNAGNRFSTMMPGLRR